MMTPFQHQKSKILRERGTTQPHSGIEEGPLPTKRTRVSRFDLYTALDHPDVFEQFEHLLELEVLEVKLLQRV